MESPSGDFSNFSECPKSNTTTKLLRRSSSSSIHDSDQLKPPQVVRISVSDPNATDSSSNEEEEKETEFTPFRQRRRTVKKFISEITVVEVSSSSCSGAAGSSWEEEVQRISPSRRPWEAYLASAQTIANNGISKKSDWNVGIFPVDRVYLSSSGVVALFDHQKKRTFQIRQEGLPYIGKV
ncbi:hypothetical protein LINGRAHAP2_LOCUS26261 [Linum grandiflorum]